MHGNEGKSQFVILTMSTLHEWLAEEPFTLALSSGYFGFFAHFGLLSVLERHALIPRRITGSSAGALAGACWASGCSIEQSQTEIFSLTRHSFWDPSLGAGLLKGGLFRSFLDNFCPVATLEACPIPVTISAFEMKSRSTHHFSTGSLSHTVYASCCVPLLFQPVRIGEGLYFDGGILDPSGLADVKNGTRLLQHHIPLRWQTRTKAPLNKAAKPQLIHAQNGVRLTIPALERVGPLRMERGRSAFIQAAKAMQQALQMPVIDDRC